MRQSSIAFDSKGVDLEGIVSSPQGLSGGLPGVVVCHPHPLFGGDMDNSLVVSICKALVDQGFATLRFNFRGVGNSEGHFTKGEKEREDVRFALEFLRQWPGVNKGRLGLVGYSFGASMVLSGLSSFKASKAFALVSPPLSALQNSGVATDKRPKLILVGDRDRLVPYTSLKEVADSHPPSLTLEIVQGADHAWRGYEGEVADQVAKFFVGTLYS